MTTQPTRSYKGTGINNRVLSDSQLENVELDPGTIACRSHGIGNGYLLFITPSNEQPPMIDGIEWNEMFVNQTPELGQRSNGISRSANGIRVTSMIEQQTETSEVVNCDVCSLPFQIGETYMTWRLAFGLLAFHLGCSQTFTPVLRTHEDR